MPTSAPDHSTPRDRRNNRRNAWLLVAFVASLAAAEWSLRRDLVPPGVPAWGVAVLPLLVGGLVIWSYVRFVRDADELQRTIQLNALALAFGVSVVIGLAYPTMELVGAPAIGPGGFRAVGILLYLGGVSLGNWWYR